MKKVSNDLSKMNEILKLPEERRCLEIALWTASIIDQYKPLRFPEMPDQMMEYLQTDRMRRLRVSREFWEQPEIKMYLQLRNKVYVFNMSCLNHLNFCLSVLNDAGHIDLNIIKEALKYFDETKKYHNNRIKEISDQEEEFVIPQVEYSNEPKPISVDDIDWDEDEPRKEKRRADIEN